MVNIVSREEHVSSVEWFIRTLKDQVRAMAHALPYEYFPSMMTQALVKSATHLINQFPNKDSINNAVSPNAIILGTPRTDYNTLQIAYGMYAQVYTSTDYTNKYTCALALRPSNHHGSYYFLLLSTGWRINVLL